ncbi:aspartate kinase [Candidatus Pelagibacter sp. RS40]|uniref:aspartate kinase n=1 Tax=Candidatus Pelagibacter sp. RS40 TaxID=1977865 RepID=UPI000A15A57F|nr:aspartate kinase [Candidatus Pelagibacter sp. RS40]ARJ49218.1 aspartate kinase [Candidatus Pelagibacter sp. RS40]
MKIVVLKFGGTSVGTINRIKKVAEIISSYVKQKYKVIVVSSAMSGATNDLVKKSKEISSNFSNAEYDVLVSSGEQVACSLIAGRLIHKGYKARSWLAWQIPIYTDNNHKFSRINQINKNKILRYLKSGGIPIITGFQGINKEERITTIGRGGSDASAIMLATFFKAKRCIIYTDVEGVYTTDPNKLKSAKKIKIISYEEMLEMASLGAKVMQPVSIQDARLNRINIEVKSSFNKKSGTLITKRKNIIKNKIITGISSTQNDAKVTLVGVKDKPGIAAAIFKPLSKNSINVDMVVQNISANGKETDLTFTIKSDDLVKTKKIINENKSINFTKLIFDKNVSKISIIGVGMVTTPGVTFRMFQALANQKINIQVISTSEIKISVLVNKIYVKKAILVLHKEFKLEK